MRRNMKYITALLLLGILFGLCSCTKQESMMPEQTVFAQAEGYPSAPAAEAPATPNEPAPEPIPDEPEPLPEPESPPEPEPVLPENCTRVLTGEGGSTYVIEETLLCEGYSLSVRSYESYDESNVTFLRAQGTSPQPQLWSFHIPEQVGTLWCWQPANKQWTETPLTAGEYPIGPVVINLDSGASYFFYLPKTFVPMEMTVMRHVPWKDGKLLITAAENGGWDVSMVAGELVEGEVCDAFFMTAPWTLTDWETESCASAIARFTEDGSDRWCFDGSYRYTPATYDPTGENCYYRHTASYLPEAITRRLKLCAAAPALAVAMLDTIAQNQNDLGFWYTEPCCIWLEQDHGIGAGFYDTRFNTGLMEQYITVRNTLGLGLFADLTDRYVDFYLSMAEGNHRETVNGGWLIGDYWHEEPHSTPLTSLNHQLSEALCLYHLADLLGREDLRQLADRMILAIEDTGESWLKPDGSFHYAILPDGTYGKQDYPYLTYNDMFALQKYFRTTRGEENQTIAMLMEKKLASMQALGITGYYK